MDIPGVPTTIPRASIKELVSALGLDPDSVAKLTFYPTAVLAEVHARDTDGQRFTPAGGLAAVHHIYIPIVE